MGNRDMTMENNQNESITERIKRMFSLSEDSASNDEIRSRLLDGGKVIRIAVGYIDMHAAMDIAP